MVNNFLQNHFTVGDEDSSSDGDSVTISFNDGGDNTTVNLKDHVEEAVTNHVEEAVTIDNPAAEQPAAATETPARSQRARIPRHFFQAGTTL